MTEPNPQDMIEVARAAALNVCLAQNGNVDPLANDVARSVVWGQLAGDPDLTFMVVRVLAGVVNTLAAQVVAVATADDPSDDVIARIGTIDYWLRQTFAGLDVSSGPP